MIIVRCHIHDFKPHSSRKQSSREPCHFPSSCLAPRWPSLLGNSIWPATAQIQEAAAADPATETSSQLWSCTSINEMAEEWNRWECPGHLGTPHNHYAHVLVGTAASCPTSAASRGKAEHMPRGHGTSTAALQGWENQAYRFNYINQSQKKPPFIHFAIESPRCSLLKLTNSSVPSCYPWPLGLPCHHCSHSQWAKVQQHPKGGGFSSRGYIRASFL